MAKEKTQNYELVPYEISKNNLLQVKQADETVWLTQKQIADELQIKKQVVNNVINGRIKSRRVDNWLKENLGI